MSERDAALAALARETAYSPEAVARCVSLLGPDLGRAFVGAAARAGADERLLLEGLRGYLLLQEGVRKKQREERWIQQAEYLERLAVDRGQQVEALKAALREIAATEDA